MDNIISISICGGGPVDDEMAERLAARAENVGKARAAIVNDCGEWARGPSSAGCIDCPVCGGIEKLQYSRSGYNGHIRARCETDGCVAWME